MQLALGLIETKGLIGAIEAADAMAKAADVRILNKEKSTGALVTIKIVGEVAAVRAAVDAGCAAASRIGQLVSSHIIPRPHDDIDFILEQNTLISFPISPNEKAKKKKEKEVEIEESVSVAEVEVKEEILVPSVEEQVVEANIPDSVKDDFEIELEFEEEKPNVKGLDHLEKLRAEAKKELDSGEFDIEQENEDDDSGDEAELTELPAFEELEKLNVHELRKMARSFSAFPIKGREISKANRGTLLDFFKEL
ncbi:MAG: BMC domain-containing protein [Bacteroidetes bacterium]|nr:BMC domain-containing protein [Bacteroidota bacterium]